MAFRIRKGAVLAFCVGMAGPAAGFEVIGLNWTHNAQPMGEKMEICLDNAPSGAAAAIKRAAATWKYAKFEFTFDPDKCSSGGAFPKDNGINQIDFGALPDGNAVGAAKPYGTDPKMTECDIRMNNTLSWNTGTGTPGANQWDLESAVLHELGHCLGLGDVPQNPFGDNVVMEPLAKAEKRRALKTDDIDGRASIYGQ